MNILLMTHGEMARGMYDAAQMILGEQADFDWLSFRPEQSLDGLIRGLKEKLDGFGNGAPCLVLVDLFGGSPSNAIVHLLAEGYELQAVAGVNLPMLIQALSTRGSDATEEWIGEIRAAGTEGMVDIRVVLMEK